MLIQLHRQQHSYLDVLETHPHQEVGRPVAKTSNRDGSGPGPLAEELGHDEPGDGAGADFKKGHKAEDGHNADVGHPPELVLNGAQRTPRGLSGKRFQWVLQRWRETRTSSAMATVRNTAETAIPIKPTR